MTREEKIAFIEEHHEEGMVRLKRLLDRRPFLMEGNAYGECFTERQFSLVWEPLLDAAFTRARILASLSRGEKTVKALAGELSLGHEVIFDHLKELLRRNAVEICGSDNRYPLFRKR